VNASRGQLHKIDSINPHSFSASNYFFVSARVARAFPGLLESAIVLSYQSPAVSAELREKWGLQRSTSHKSGLWRQLWTFMQDLDFASMLSLLTTTVLMSLGAQALIVQRVVVTSLNPAIIAVIAYVGSFILNRPLLGTLIVVGGLSVLFAVWFVYWRSHNASNKTHAVAVDDQKLDGIVPENYIPARNTAYRNVAAEFATLKKHLIQIQNEDDGDSVDYETMAATLRQIARGSSADVSASASEDDNAVVRSLGTIARGANKSPCSDAESKHCDEFSLYSTDGGSRASSPNNCEELSPYVIVDHALHESLTPCTQNPIAMDAHSTHRYSVLKTTLKDIAAQDDCSDEIMSNSSISICLAELAPDSKQSSVFSSDSGSSSSDDEYYLPNSTAETVSPASAQWERLMHVALTDLEDGSSEDETKNGTDKRSLDSLFEQTIDHHSSSAASAPQSDHQGSDDIADELDSTGLPTGRSLQTIIHRHSVVSGLLARIAREVDSEDDEDD
jgi:hypothetical protein